MGIYAVIRSYVSIDAYGTYVIKGVTLHNSSSNYQMLSAEGVAGIKYVVYGCKFTNVGEETETREWGCWGSGTLTGPGTTDFLLSDYTEGISYLVDVLFINPAGSGGVKLFEVHVYDS